MFLWKSGVQALNRENTLHSKADSHMSDHRFLTVAAQIPRP